MKKSLDVVGAAIISGNRILCAKRGYGPLTGLYEFPGGKIEANETPEQALIREIKEELDVDIKIIKHIKTSSYDYPEFHINLSVYTANIISGTINDHEHTKLIWIDKDKLDSLKWCPADEEIITELMK